MVVAIIGYTEQDYEKLKEEMENLVVTSGCYLFYVLCGGPNSIAAKWADEVGLPKRYIKDLGNPINEICWKADFLVACKDGSIAMNRLVFKFMQTGKHGRVWEKGT